MRTINYFKPINGFTKLLAGTVVVSMFSFHANAQLSNKLLEKAVKAKAKSSAVETEGDQGRVLVYASADRKQEVTDITGLGTIYCTAFLHPKASKNAAYRSSAKYGLWKGENCGFNNAQPCEEYAEAGSERLIVRNELNGKSKAKVEKFDFEVNLIEATEWEVKNNMIKEGNDFYVVLHDGSGSKKFLSVSNKLTFDVKASSKKYALAKVEENKGLKLKPGVFEDAQLEAAVKKLFLQRGMSEVVNINFTSAWNINRDAAGNILRKSCRVALSGKEDGQCKFYWFKVWEEYMGGGKYQLPVDKNESFNGFNSELVPCENL